MKLWKMIGIMLFVFFLFTQTINAHAASRKSQEQPDTSFSVQEWFSRANASWQISFPYDNISSGGHGSGRIESELNFKHIDSPVTILRGRGDLSLKWSFDAAYGLGSIHGGRGTDTDRDFPSTGGETVFSESEEDIGGDVRLWEINIYYRQRQPRDKTGSWGMIFGFFHYEDNLEITNGVQTISVPGWWWNPGSNPPLGQFSGLNSTYNFSWNALRVGALREAPLYKNLYYSAVFSVYPYVTYDGEGFWNLRADLRPQSPNFVHKSTSGFGYDASLGLAYQMTATIEFSAGYRYLYLKAKNGTDTTYFADGSTGVADLDWAKVTRQGAYAGILIRF